jgi:NhaP-type Na+/H+ and K+/H+ antiporter
LNVFEIIQELNGNLTEEEKVAFLLVSVDSSLASIAEDIILKNNCVTLTEQQIKRSYLDYELISKYYKTSIKSSDLIEVEYQEKNNLSIKNLNPIEEIKKSLEPFKFKNIGEKKKHFQDVILPEYANYLIESGYNIDETTKKDSIFNLIFKK